MHADTDMDMDMDMQMHMHVDMSMRMPMGMCMSWMLIHVHASACISQVAYEMFTSLGKALPSEAICPNKPDVAKVSPRDLERVGWLCMHT